MIVGIGVDVVDHARIRAMLARMGAERMLGRLLTDGERSYCGRMKDAAPHIAARVAAKEATFKALSGSVDARAIGWREMEVVHDDHRRPLMQLHGRAAARAAELGLSGVHLSITHGDTSAVAMAIAERG